MRWFYFLILVLLALIIQSGIAQVLWLRTSIGQVGPELLAAVAVFVALNVTNGTDAALAGWTLGMALDLTMSGEGMGLLAILYAGGAAGVFRVRGIFFREYAMTHAVLTFLLTAFAFETWMCFSLVTNSAAGSSGRHLLQALAVAGYSAVLAPVVCRLLKPLGPLIITGYGQRDRR